MSEEQTISVFDEGAPVSASARASLRVNQDAHFGKPEILVTDEMLEAGVAAAFGDSYSEVLLADVYRAMAAVAPKTRNVPYDEYDKAISRIAQLTTDRNFWHNAANHNLDFLNQESGYRKVERENALDVIGAKDREIAQLRAEREAWKYLYEMAKTDPDARMLKADETGNQDYHGPVKDGKAVPDPVHERFHGSVGDVISGNVLRPARDQMEKALADAKVKDGKAPPPFPVAPKMSDPRLGGP